MDKKTYTVLFSGGGTSGHIYPALAIAQALHDRYPEIDIQFVGTATGLESRVVPAAGYRFHAIEAAPFPSRPGPALLRALQTFRRGRRQCHALAERLQPLAVVGTGGYVCAPLLSCAIQRRLPSLIHEQNAYPGRNNRLMGRKVSAVCVSYPEAMNYFRSSRRVICTGNPVRKAFFDAFDREREEGEGLRVLISGGSLGARSLNFASLEWARKYGAGFPGKLILAAGSRLYEETFQKAQQMQLPPQLEIRPYIEDMVEEMRRADLVIGRAGAITCAELAALGKPSILVPYPYAAGDHQTHNARALEAKGAAYLCPDADFNADCLEAQLQRFQALSSGDRERMQRAARSLSRPDAAEAIVEELRSVILSRGKQELRAVLQ